jgi:hypothetical protein
MSRALFLRTVLDHRADAALRPVLTALAPVRTDDLRL